MPSRSRFVSLVLSCVLVACGGGGSVSDDLMCLAHPLPASDNRSPTFIVTFQLPDGSQTVRYSNDSVTPTVTLAVPGDMTVHVFSRDPEGGVKSVRVFAQQAHCEHGSCAAIEALPADAPPVVAYEGHASTGESACMQRADEYTQTVDLFQLVLLTVRVTDYHGHRTEKIFTVLPAGDAPSIGSTPV